MRERPISELFDIPSRFLRSAHLERDFRDPRALNGYVLTDPTRHALERIVAGVRPESGHRAWRVTGDYGTGKSSFGLLLAHVLTERRSELPHALTRAVDFAALGVPKPRLYPLLVVGARESLAASLVRTISAAIDTLREGKRAPPELRHIKERLRAEDGSDATVMRALADLSAYLIENNIASGLLLVLDELGKFLEHCALNAEADVFLLQQLAEMAARSGDRPLVVAGFLHQGFGSSAKLHFSS